MTNHPDPFPDVISNGDKFFHNYPRDTKFWKFINYTTSVFVIGVAKILLKIFYKVEVNDFHNLTETLQKSRDEKRGLLTIMNHMSTMDDPFLWSCFPMKFYSSLEKIRWCLGAHNICFATKWKGIFFSLGNVLSAERFGGSPFQGVIDCGIYRLSQNGKKDGYSNWMHVFPEAFVLQLKDPHNNSMRYFKWGFTRMILEASKPPLVVPMFGTGFEKIATEDEDVSLWKHFVNSWGTKVNITVGKPVDEKIIDSYRLEWAQLVKKYAKPDDTYLNDKLKYGDEAQSLRSRLASELRLNVANIRHNQRKFPLEDDRFKSHHWWKRYTETEGESDKDVNFIGRNFAIRRFQDFLNIKPAETKDNNIINKKNVKEEKINESLKKKTN